MNTFKRIDDNTITTDNGDVYELKKKAFTLRPSEGNEFDVLHIDGSIETRTWIDDGRHVDIWNQGNALVNDELAILERDARIKERELTDLIAELNHREGWACDWSDGNQGKKYFRYYDFRDDDLRLIYCRER